mmetsp:Transcript_124045/g.358744  ORF Transcript_124045/g.358744 Transcript_124045/m.358744 type:complete len:210 (-) Transcript_124045:130-759(-)
MVFWCVCTKGAADSQVEEVINTFRNTGAMAEVAYKGSATDVDGECTSGAEAPAMASQRSISKQVVKDFTQSVRAGRPITLLRERADGLTVDRVDATLSLNPSHALFTIAAPGGQVNIDILCLCDIYALAWDGDAVFPKRMLTHLTDDESKRLLRLYYETYTGKLRCLMLLESAAGSVDHFVLGVSALREHAALRVRSQRHWAASKSFRR